MFLSTLHLKGDNDLNVSTISRQLAAKLGNSTGKSSEVEYLRYGIEILITGIFKGFCLYFTAYLLNILIEVIWLSLTFVIFRSLTGGHHYSTYRRCLIAGLLIMNGSAFSVQFITRTLSPWLSYLIIFAILFGIYSCIKFAPSNHFYRKMTEVQRSKLKSLSLLLIFLWGGLILMLVYTGYTNALILSSFLGFMLQIISLYPVSYSITKKIENILDKEVRT